MIIRDRVVLMRRKVVDARNWNSEPSPGSIDVLIEFGPDCIPGLMDVAGMELALSEHFDGRKVDLRTSEDLSPYFRKEVLKRADVQYAKR